MDRRSGSVVFEAWGPFRIDSRLTALFVLAIDITASCGLSIRGLTQNTAGLPRLDGLTEFHWKV